MSLVLRPTASLAKRMKLKLQKSEETSSGRLGDWYANDIILNRKQYILCVSENARLSVLLNAAPYATWPTRLATPLKELLLGIGVDEDAVEKELAQMSEIKLAKTRSRSVLGSIRDVSLNLQAFEMQGRLLDTRAATFWLADMISLILPLGTPKNTVLSILAPRMAKIIPLHPQGETVSKDWIH